MKSIGNLLLFLFFWKIFLWVKLLTWLAPLYRRKKSTQVNSVLFYEIFPRENAGYEYRSRQWAERFRQRGKRVDILTLIEDKEAFYRGFRLPHQVPFSFLRILWTRFFQIFRALQYDAVIVRRELLIYIDYGNLFFEKWLLAIHPNVMLDFDDDIAAAKKEPRVVDSFYGKLLLENGNKFSLSRRMYPKAIVGSRYLQSTLGEHVRSILIPTCVDYNHQKPKEYTAHSERICFGWIGGNQNLGLLHQITYALEEINKEFPLQLLVVSGNEFRAEVSYPIINEKWSLETEKDSIRKMDIGLMPLGDTAIARGKCGFKLIQYMGLGVVSIASAITANTDIVDDGVNGFLVYDPKDWAEKIRDCIRRRADWPQMGKAAHTKIEQEYSFDSQLEKYLNFLEA